MRKIPEMWWKDSKLLTDIFTLNAKKKNENEFQRNISGQVEKVQDNDHNQIHGNSLLRLSLRIMNVENEQLVPPSGSVFPKWNFGDRECSFLVPTISMVALRWKVKIIFILINNCHSFVILFKVHHCRHFWERLSLSAVVFCSCRNLIAELNFSSILTTLVKGTFTDRNFHCFSFLQKLMSTKFFRNGHLQNFLSAKISPFNNTHREKLWVSGQKWLLGCFWPFSSLREKCPNT